MKQEYDVLQTDIRDFQSYKKSDLGFNPDPQCSILVLEFLQRRYRSFDWEFMESFNDYKIIRYGENNAIKPTEKSRLYEILGPDVAITGSLDFDFNISSLYQGLPRNQKIDPSFFVLAEKKYSILNMSPTILVEGVPLPMPKMIPVFLYNLNRYFAGKYNHLFDTYNDNQEERLTEYLDNAFIGTMSPGQTSYIEDYCSKVLFIDNQELIRELLNLGEKIQLREDKRIPIIKNAEEAYKFINLVTWYWAEKEVNMLSTL
ncbi:hypothetical protein [Companilactobacillus muriivasis]|uniref:hypothetical protein n=1 Tax=Companilactobacillus muriivasis TaxID=3081444 RepID=UPI0030C70D4C